jgi:hypothetical protein
MLRIAPLNTRPTTDREDLVAAFDVFVDMEVRVKYRVYASSVEEAEQIADNMAQDNEEGEVVERDVLPGVAELAEGEEEDE